MLCMRLHTLIFAAHMGVPTLGLVYDPKVREYLSMLGFPSAGDVENLDLAEAIESVGLMLERIDDCEAGLKGQVETLRIQAEENSRLLDELIEKQR